VGRARNGATLDGMRLVAHLLAAGLLPACADPPASPPSPGADDTVEAAARQRAERAAKQLGSTLLRELMQALANGEPATALEVCSTRAPAISAEVGESSGVIVGRSSLRLRNPGNAAPTWVRSWLDEQGERPAAGVTGFTRVDETPNGKVARFLAPIVVEGPCLNCHGARDTLTPRVVALLDERYPQDAATGYAAGDLRGALWAEAVVAP
jgi:hypothetical protein